MSSGWEGSAALLCLMRLKARARVRGLLRSLKRPRRLILLLFLAGLVALVVAGQLLGAGKQQSFQGADAERWISVLLSFLMLTTLVGATSHGVIVFSPAEVQFLFPAPLGTRALLASHLATSLLRSLSGSVIFALFLRPWDTPFAQAVLSYFLLFLTLVLLGLSLDLGLQSLHPARRKRLGRWLGIGALLAALGVVLVPVLQGERFSASALQPLGWLARPWTGLLLARTQQDLLASLLPCLLIPVVLALRPLSFRGNLRESAMHTSDLVQRRLRRISRGDLEQARRLPTDGRTLPMLPHWGGAGVHIWRQLSSLSRRRKSYALMATLAIFAGVTVGVQSFRETPDLTAAVIVGLLTMAGPLYVQCDFRSDYDSLAYLRSLPTSPSALAAGQVLASALVISAFQLALGGWILAFTGPAHRPFWLAAFAALPLINLVQLCVENGVFLLIPHRIDYSRGPPGALQLARMYAVMLLKFLVLLVSLLLVALPAWLVALPLKQPALGITLAFGLLVLECVLLVWLVGRLFVRVDPGRDLQD